MFYINALGLHWNIAGKKFFEVHLKFEEIYNDSLLKVDEIAERILTLRETPFHTFSDYLQVTTQKECKNISKANVAVKEVVNGYRLLISQEREIINLSSSAGDEGTNALMSDYIRQQEKFVWMY